MLFFLLNSLSKIHAFYQFSLNAFVVVFGRGLDNAPGGRKKQVSMRKSADALPQSDVGVLQGGLSGCLQIERVTLQQHHSGREMFGFGSVPSILPLSHNPTYTYNLYIYLNQTAADYMTACNRMLTNPPLTHAPLQSLHSFPPVGSQGE